MELYSAIGAKLKVKQFLAKVEKVSIILKSKPFGIRHKNSLGWLNFIYKKTSNVLWLASTFF